MDEKDDVRGTVRKAALGQGYPSLSASEATICPIGERARSPSGRARAGSRGPPSPCRACWHTRCTPLAPRKSSATIQFRASGLSRDPARAVRFGRRAPLGARPAACRSRERVAGLDLFTESLTRLVQRAGEPVALVADFASRLIVRHDALSPGEHQAFTRALLASQVARARPCGTPPRPTFNSVFWDRPTRKGIFLTGSWSATRASGTCRWRNPTTGTAANLRLSCCGALRASAAPRRNRLPTPSTPSSRVRRACCSPI